MMAKVKVQKRIHQQLSPKDDGGATEAFSAGIAIVSKQFFPLMEKTYQNMAYKIENNGLRYALYEGIRLQGTLRWGT